jgi:organic hydroperoxide reductase OsmC/OhrA
MSEAAVERLQEAVSEFSIGIDQIEDFEFRVSFDKPHYEELQMDEPEPLGRDAAPNPSRILAAAVGDCLCASLLFCARKARVQLGRVAATVRVQMVRNAEGRLRIGRVEVEIDPRMPAAEKEKAARCLTLFEDFCVVTQSVREGIDVDVRVKGM